MRKKERKDNLTMTLDLQFIANNLCSLANVRVNVYGLAKY
jgi:hypothetical protein